MTITSVLTRVFSPTTYAARKAVAHEQVFRKALGDLLKNVGNLQKEVKCTNVGLRSNDAHLALSDLRKSIGNPLSVSMAKLQLHYVKVLKKDLESQLKDALKANGWQADHLKPLNALYKEASKLQHFRYQNHPASGG